MSEQRTPLDEMDTAAHAALPTRVILQQWRTLPPILRGAGVTLREVKLGDAPALLAVLSPGELGQIFSPVPSAVADLVEAIERLQAARLAGQAVTLGMVPDGYAAPVGLVQVRQVEPEFGVAEWSIAIGTAFWGTGLFMAAAPLVVDFVFDVLDARRLEARVSVRNGRGTGALRKLGAVQEALLRESLAQDGEAIDEVLWSIVSDEWRDRRSPGGQVH